MGKSKRNRKKTKPAAAEPVVVAPATPRNRLNVGRKPLLIGLIVLVIIIGLYVWHHGRQPSPTATQTPSILLRPQTDLPVVQSGNSGSLSPSGSVDLQPTGSATSVGSVQ